MELAKRHNHVTSGGVIGGASNFKIAMNAKMFRVLSDTMYQDKVGSMVRELSCNAMDAHIEGGTPDLPFTIHLPDSIEPWFAVKDTGVGLSDKHIRGVATPMFNLDDDGVEVPILDAEGNQAIEYIGGIYTTYGESTKDQSNDMVGAFGLGSKTPFAYTDQFTVTSVHDGVKRIYVAVMNDKGLPDMLLQGESETTEHAGLEVNVAVRDSDYDAFRSAVKKQLCFFAIKPKLLNNRTGIEFDNLDREKDINIDMDGIRVYKGGYHCQIKGIWIVQGGVGYPLSIEQLGDIDSHIKTFANGIKDDGAVLHFPIGQIEVTASREGISYTDNVRERIVKRLSETAALICKEALDKISQEKSVWNRAVIYNKTLDVIQNAIRQSDDFEKLFHGTEVETRGNARMSIETDRLNTLGFSAVLMARHTGRKRGSYGEFERLIRRTVGQSDSNRYSYSGVKLYPEMDMHIFVRDTNSKPVARIKKLAVDEDWPTILVIESNEAKEITAKDIGQISTALGIDKSGVRLLSSLEAPKTVRGGGGGQLDGDRRPRAWMLPSNGGGSYSRDWTKVYDDLDDLAPAVYFEMDRHDVKWGTNGSVVMAAARQGTLGMEIIAVNRQTFQRILNGKIGTQLVSIDDAAKPILTKIEEVQPIIRAIAKYRSFMSAFNRNSRLMEELSSAGVLKSTAGVSKRIAQLKERVGKWGYLENHPTLDAQPHINAGLEAGQMRNAEVMTQYPMLNHIGSHVSEDTLKDVIDYVKMVDKRG